MKTSCELVDVHCNVALCVMATTLRLFFFTGTFWSLKHFEHLSHNIIETHRNSIHYSIFLDFVTELAKFFL